MSVTAIGQQLKQTVRILAGSDGVTDVKSLPKGSLGLDTPLQRLTVRLGGQAVYVTVRVESHDRQLVGMILREEGEYALPASIDPSMIFDIGANIGVTALYLAATYPKATIHCFEPLPDNLVLLKENASQFGGRVHVHPFGLSDADGSFTYNMSADPKAFGGGTFCKISGDPERELTLPVRRIDDVIAEVGVASVDVFKVDIEGSEWPVIRTIPEAMRRQAQVVIGELHGIHDWDVCNLLSRSHGLGISKRYDRNCFNFLAVRKDLV